MESTMDIGSKPTAKQLQDARKHNESIISDLRLQAQYEKYSYEIAHYRLEAQKDFMESERIREEFMDLQNKVLQRIESQKAPVPENNLEN